MQIFWKFLTWNVHKEDRQCRRIHVRVRERSAAEIEVKSQLETALRLSSDPLVNEVPSDDVNEQHWDRDHSGLLIRWSKVFLDGVNSLSPT